MSNLSIVGMGPGSPEYLTRSAAAELATAEIVLVDDVTHPVSQWMSSIRTVTGTDATSVGHTIADLWVAGHDIVVGISGSPARGNAIVEAVVKAASNVGLDVRILPGLSIMDVARSVLPAAAWAESTQVIRLGSEPGNVVDEASSFLGVYRPIDPTRTVLIDLEYRRSFQPLELRRILEPYPPEHRIWEITIDDSGAARVNAITVRSLLDRSSDRRLRGLSVEALDRLADRRGFDTLSYIVARLRAPDGCPWDREQDYGSIKKHLIEETYEAVAALDEADYGKFAEELGDVLLQVMMYGQLAREAGDFTLEDVLQSVNDKLVRRHPHVFGEIEVKDSAEVLKNWEKIKRTEQTEKPGYFSGVPEAAPALMRAEAIQSRAERYGWERPAATRSVEAVEAAGTSRDAQLSALGNVLFDVVSVARRYRLDPEEALRLATNRFRSNFDRALGDQPDHGMAFDSLSVDERRKILEVVSTEQAPSKPSQPRSLV